jgi:hypothetical protein
LYHLCLQAAAAAAADAQPAGRPKGARGKAGSKGKAGAAAGQSAAAVAAAALLQDPQQLQLAGLLAVMAGMSPQVSFKLCMYAVVLLFCPDAWCVQHTCMLQWLKAFCSALRKVPSSVELLRNFDQERCQPDAVVIGLFAVLPAGGQCCSS